VYHFVTHFFAVRFALCNMLNPPLIQSCVKVFNSMGSRQFTLGSYKIKKQIAKVFFILPTAYCQLRNPDEPEPKRTRLEITNYKSQITSKLQIPISKITNSTDGPLKIF